jgi:hypothetical protein
VADRFLSEHVAKKRKQRTFESYNTLIRNYIVPAIGSLRIIDLRRVDLDRLHSSMGAMPGAANRALSLVSAIWNWAAKRDLVRFEENPARGIERNPERAKVFIHPRAGAARRRAAARRDDRAALCGR